MSARNRTIRPILVKRTAVDELGGIVGAFLWISDAAVQNDIREALNSGQLEVAPPPQQFQRLIEAKKNKLLGEMRDIVARRLRSERNDLSEANAKSEAEAMIPDGNSLRNLSDADQVNWLSGWLPVISKTNGRVAKLLYDLYFYLQGKPTMFASLSGEDAENSIKEFVKSNSDNLTDLAAIDAASPTEAGGILVDAGRRYKHDAKNAPSRLLIDELQYDLTRATNLDEGKSYVTGANLYHLQTLLSNRLGQASHTTFMTGVANKFLDAVKIFHAVTACAHRDIKLENAIIYTKDNSPIQDVIDIFRNPDVTDQTIEAALELLEVRLIDLDDARPLDYIGVYSRNGKNHYMIAHPVSETTTAEQLDNWTAAAMAKELLTSPDYQNQGKNKGLYANPHTDKRITPLTQKPARRSRLSTVDYNTDRFDYTKYFADVENTQDIENIGTSQSKAFSQRLKTLFASAKSSPSPKNPTPETLRCSIKLDDTTAKHISKQVAAICRQIKWEEDNAGRKNITLPPKAQELSPPAVDLKNLGDRLPYQVLKVLNQDDFTPSQLKDLAPHQSAGDTITATTDPNIIAKVPWFDQTPTNQTIHGAILKDVYAGNVNKLKNENIQERTRNFDPYLQRILPTRHRIGKRQNDITLLFQGKPEIMVSYAGQEEGTDGIDLSISEEYINKRDRRCLGNNVITQKKYAEFQNKVNGLNALDFKIASASLNPSATPRLMRHIAKTLVSAYCRRLCAHGDLKPENFMVTHRSGNIAQAIAEFDAATTDQDVDNLINGFDITFIDHDQNRAFDDTDLSYPDNAGANGETWRLPRTCRTALEKENWILKQVVYHLTSDPKKVNRDYHKTALFPDDDVADDDYYSALAATEKAFNSNPENAGLVAQLKHLPKNRGDSNVEMLCDPEVLADPIKVNHIKKRLNELLDDMEAAAGFLPPDGKGTIDQDFLNRACVSDRSPFTVAELTRSLPAAFLAIASSDLLKRLDPGVVYERINDVSNAYVAELAHQYVVEKRYDLLAQLAKKYTQSNTAAVQSGRADEATKNLFAAFAALSVFNKYNLSYQGDKRNPDEVADLKAAKTGVLARYASKLFPDTSKIARGDSEALATRLHEGMIDCYQSLRRVVSSDNALTSKDKSDKQILGEKLYAPDSKQTTRAQKAFVYFLLAVVSLISFGIPLFCYFLVKPAALKTAAAALQKLGNALTEEDKTKAPVKRRDISRSFFMAGNPRRSEGEASTDSAAKRRRNNSLTRDGDAGNERPYF